MQFDLITSSSKSCSIQAQFMGVFVQVSVPFRHISWEYILNFVEGDTELIVYKCKFV